MFHVEQDPTGLKLKLGKPSQARHRLKRNPQIPEGTKKGPDRSLTL